MATTFHKMHGLGNDFVIFDAREADVPLDAARVRLLADRHRGIGCDQLIRLSPSDKADLLMDIWNADGGEAEACGNAARCVAALTGAKTIDSAGGLLEAEAGDDSVSITLPPPRFQWDEIPIADPMDTAPVPMAWDVLEGADAVNVGNPHLVFFVDDADAVALGEIGPQIEHDPAFPERINVNVAEVRDGRLKLRTFERGAGLTEACGTGACASAVAAIRRKLLASPVAVDMPGGSLTIHWAPGDPIVMQGAATHVFTGEVDLEALR
ncbi:diaminopimelate epimerase [Sphingomicrobium sediminis]|uniref:Diaminopimelate epimerase n=1 Tax=Sphingomicrobium sediminis TaxID=2950949 RepID=A0A9X2EJT7_9SPHN|nr:diaminopimelate epimerase [Sphingomicrobium sediminis]MCM8556909.1 diaminopimelate epimerase [Sphingomicrobium sediminis]